MRSNSLTAQILYFFGYVLCQLFLFDHFVLFNTAFCFMYLGFFIQVPYKLPPYAYMLLAFLVGGMIDWFSDTMGIHIFACVLIAYIRAWLLRLLIPASELNDNLEISIGYMGLKWYIIYGALMCFIHFSALFLLEAASFDLFWWTLSKIFTSTLLSVAVIVMFQYLLHSPDERSLSS